MRIAEVHPQPDWVLSIVAEGGRVGRFDVSPYLEFEAFEELRNHDEFMKVRNGDYLIEWEFGTDLSTDTLGARWRVVGEVHPRRGGFW